MNRYQPRIVTNQRLVLENFRHDEEVYYLSTTGSLDLKRPNIISRRANINNNNSKFQVYQVQTVADSTPSIVSTPNGSISYIETYDPGEITVIPEAVPIELLSPDSFIVSEAPYPAVTELSLTLEPTVVDQPLPTEIPLAFDSTTVSQAIPTPIVTPIVSSSGLASEYITTDTHPTFHLYYPGQDIVQISDQNELGISMEVVDGDTSTATEDPIYLDSVDPLAIEGEDGGEDEYVLGVEESHEEEAVEIDETAELSSTPGQMRIETQADGTLVLYVEGPASNAIDILSDAEIIQTDTYPVVPNMPVVLPSQQNAGQTETFILVPIDDQGNTVLVPTSSIMKTRSPVRRNLVLPRTPPYQHVSIPRASIELNPEKPKPYRYELPEDQDPHLDKPGMTNFYNFSSSIVSESNSNIEEENPEEETQTLEQALSASGEELQLLNTNAFQEEATTKDTTRERCADKVIERTSMGIFRCRFCSRETRLKVLMLNHIKRSHKNLDASQSHAVSDPVRKTDIGVDPETIFKDSSTSPIISIVPSQQIVTPESPSSIENLDQELSDDSAQHVEALETEDTTDSDGCVERLTSPQKADCSEDPSEARDTLISVKTKRKRQKLIEWNPKLQKTTSVPIALFKEKQQHLSITKTSANPRKYPSKNSNASSVVERPNLIVTIPTPAPARMRTRSHSDGERSLRS